MSSKPRGALRLVTSYNFVDKQEIIDEVRTIVQDEGMSLRQIELHSGVCSQTMAKWFNGKTRRPQAPTINAVLKVFGKRLGVVDAKK
jgi:transcriptional regulator with XRE-family HTH domain